MIYDVTLKIGYDYRSTVKDARHILRVRLRESAWQSVTAQSVRVSPKADEAPSERDFFGNGIDHILLRHAHEALSVEMRARVRVFGPATELEATPSLATIREEALRERDAGSSAPMHFLGESRLVQRSKPVEAYVRDALPAGHGTSPGGSDVLALTRRIRADFAYAPGTTRIDTPVDEVFQKRQGVCQDFAHLMIAGLRGIGIPAAYVSGFLRTDPPPSKPRLEGSDAMHAWVKVWLGREAGWTGFDPTNGVAASTDHIEVAIGRDYADVAPVSGILVTSGQQRMRHAVDVVPVGEEPAI